MLVYLRVGASHQNVRSIFEKVMKTGLCTCIFLITLQLAAQPKSGHMTFGLVRYDILDTAGMNVSQAERIAKDFAKIFEAELYFNSKKALVLSSDNGIESKIIFDRKKEIVYMFRDSNDATINFTDTIQGYTIPMAGSFIDINSNDTVPHQIKYPDIRKKIFGFECYKVSDVDVTGINAYLTIQPIIPCSLVGAFPFIFIGAPMEFTIPYSEKLSIVVGAIKFKPGHQPKDIFKVNLDGFKMIEF